MMDFENILSIASQNQGLSNVQQKRYSLQTGPAKKDPRVKGVNSSAVQAFLKKQDIQHRKKELQMKKQKDELIAKRVELKSDRKARAMASRTKDNFRGYNGVPVVEEPKRRRSKGEMEQKSSNDSYDPDDDDNYEYEQTDSEPEPETLRPCKTTSISGSSTKSSSNKPGGPPKPAPPPMNFAELLKLAEKKQFEPVELKPKQVKNEGRLRTADEIRELELERKAKRLDKGRDSKPERDNKFQPSSLTKSTLEKEPRNVKPQKNASEKPTLPSGSRKKSKPMSSDKAHSSSKPPVSDRERDRPKTTDSDRDRPKTSLSSSSGTLSSKVPSKGPSSQVPAKHVTFKPSSGHKSITSDLSSKKGNSSLPQGRPGTRPPSTSATGQKSQQGSSGQPRPTQGSSLKGGPTVGAYKSRKGEPLRPGSNSIVKSSNNGTIRPSSGGLPKPGNQPQARPGGTLQAKAGGVPQARPVGSILQGHSGGRGIRPPGSGLGRPGNGGLVPGRPAGSVGSGPGRPKCTVVSETISSKNFGGPRPGFPPRPGMPQRPAMAPRPGMPPRPMMRPPGTMLPPITSAYKRQYEDEEDEYDSEMDDFIEDGDEEQQEISKHIKEIFGYDRSRYKEESDYALKFMESSWRDQQKEEARSLKMAVQEDLEEEKRDEEELKQKKRRKIK